MQGGGQRLHRIRFDRRAPFDDGYGNTVEEWMMLTTVWCGVDTKKRGTETLEAGRLESTASWRVTVLKSAVTTAIQPDDRGVFIIGPHVGRVVNIVGVEATPDSREIALECEVSIAPGNETALSPIPVLPGNDGMEWAANEW